MQATPLKVASYCRVSTDKLDQTNSFKAQQQFFQEFIQRQPGWELYKVYADEGITGTSTEKRTQFNQMIADAYAGKFQLIITKEVSRFSRNLLDAIAYTRELKAIGVGVQFVIDGINTLNPDAELHLSIMASIAQEESRKTSSRVVWGQTRQMEKGVVFGRSLLGYEVKNGQIFVEPEGAETVKLIFYKYAVEQAGTSEIARFLEMNGRCTGRGSKKWSASAIIKILKNEKYVGDLVQRKTFTPDYLTHEKRRNVGNVPLVCHQNHHEPVVSRELWDLAQERLRKNNKHGKENSGHSNRYAFSGKIICGECGNSFVSRTRYLKDGTKVRRWCCSRAVGQGSERCSVGKLVRDDDAMHMLKIALRSILLDRDTIVSSVTSLALDAIHPGEMRNVDVSERLQNEIARIRQKKHSVLDSYFAGDISREDMVSLKEKYEQQLQVLREKHAKAEEHLAKKNDFKALESAIQAEITSVLIGEKESQVFSKTILDTLTVFKDRHMELRLNNLSHVFFFTG